MKTIGRKKWPGWVKEILGDRKGMEVKEQNGHYYLYRSTSEWNPKKKRPDKKTEYVGVLKRDGLHRAHEASLGGVYEYGHVQFVWRLFKEEGVLNSLQELFPDEWEVLLSFGLNRLLDPRPLKSLNSWYEKTVLSKRFTYGLSVKRVGRVLKKVGRNWSAQRKFFKQLRENGELLVYDGTPLFSDSKENKILEIGHDPKEEFLQKANLLLAFSHERSIPVFLRVVPGSIHEVKTLRPLLEELNQHVILVMDKGLTSKDYRKEMRGTVSYLTPLKRNSSLIDYSHELEDFFLYRDRPIKYCSYQIGEDDEEEWIYLFRDLELRTKEEVSYYQRKAKGKDVEFKEERAGTITLISDLELDPEEAFGLWKRRDRIEKVFSVYKNLLETDRPHLQKEGVFRGYLFGSFLSLLAYYLVLRELKSQELNKRVSVSDLLLELSKVYLVELEEKEILSERSRTVEDLLEKLGRENLLTKNTPG